MHSVRIFLRPPEFDLWNSGSEVIVLSSMIFDLCATVPMPLPAAPKDRFFPQIKVENFEEWISVYRYKSVTTLYVSGT